jgi:DNA-binding beta-propeller fold protein YncE
VAISGDGKVYVADHHRIQVFEADGTFVRTWGSKGTGHGQFNQPWDVAISGDGKVYVTDRRNHRIQVFDTGGTFVRTWGSKGTGHGQFTWLYGLVISDGTVYAMDRNRGIQVFE